MDNAITHVDEHEHHNHMVHAEPEATPQERMLRNQQLITMLAPEIKAKHLANIQGKNHMCVAGGIAIANCLGYTVSVGEVECNESLGVTSAKAELHDSDGKVVAYAFGYVGDDEKRWVTGPKFARLSMTQTRAEAKLCRVNFGHMYTMLGASSDTPAEEMHGVQGVIEKPAPAPKPRPVVHKPGEPGVIRPSDQVVPPSEPNPQSEEFQVINVTQKINAKTGEPVVSKSNNPCMVITLDNGIEVETFKGSWIDSAKISMTSGAPVMAEWETNKWGDHKLTAMKSASSAKRVAALEESAVATEELPF